MPVRDVDRGAKALLARVEAIARKVVIKVGIFAREGEELHKGGSESGAITVLDVAIWNEFGTDTIPERSFIRSYYDANRERVIGWILAAARSYVLNGDRKAFELVGQKIVGEIQLRIAQGIPPPNAPSTVARKGSSKPLVDTGQLRSSITYKVEGI